MSTPVDVHALLRALACDEPQCPCHRTLQRGHGLTHCPCHDDAHPSLNVTVSNDGTILLTCHAGCPNHAVIRALHDRGLWPRRERSEWPVVRETRYELRDVDGTLVAVHVRLDTADGKKLWWELPDGRKGLNGLRVEDLPLYGMHRLGDTAAVIVCEGEKAADALVRLGLPAVGTVCGASVTPSDAVLRPLIGRTVYLWPDNDDAGRAHMARIAARLAALGCADLRWLEWPDAPPRGDAADFVARGGTADDVRRLMEAAPPWTPGEAPASTGERQRAAPAHDRTERDERRSQADRLIGYALASGARFLIDQFGQPHVLVDGVPLALPRGAYPWLRTLMWQHEQRGVTGEALQVAAGTLEALALHEGERTELHVRSAWHEQARTLYVWLGPRRVLAIDAHGWRVLTDAPVLFRVYPTTGELPTPHTDGLTGYALAATLDLVAPADEAGRRLVTAWLATAWLPHVARPSLLYTGDWGAGKSLRQRAIKRLLDPTKPESLRIDSRDLTQLLMHCQIGLFDNLGALPDWAIDTLCRAVTGEGDARRRLYTDEDDLAFEYKRALLLNGINVPADRPDFTDRLLPVELERIPDDRREEETAIWARLTAEQPRVLAALADILSAAIAQLPRVQLRRKPRLADWGRWAAAVYEALGWGVVQFERDWALIVEKQQAAAVEGSPVAQAVLRFMADRHRWRGTASELLAALEPVALELGLVKAKGWPKSPVWLSRRLRELRPVLAARGITAREERDGHERARQWILARQTHSEDGPEIPSARVIPSAQARNPHPDADIDADGTADSKPGWDAIPSALLSAQDPHVDGQADGADAADGIFGAFSDDHQPAPGADAAALAEQLRERLRWLAPVHASRLAEAVGVPFEQLQPVFQALMERGQLAVVHGEARVMQHSVLVLPEQAGRLVRQTPRELWRQREGRQP
ncbi:MAG: hypothetical protein IRY86_09825 [Thermorudis peleae]|nr:hypothetical protein [Thermorudis peleae]